MKPIQPPNLAKKDLWTIIGAQTILTLIIVIVLIWGSGIKDIKKACAPVGSENDPTYNMLSSRLGQVQMDLFQIKSKLGFYPASSKKSK